MKGSIADLVRLHHEHTLSSLEPARSHSYYSDSDSELRDRVETYSPHRPLPKAALQLRDPSLVCDRNLGWNIDWAVAFIVDYLETKSADVAEALRDIRVRASILEREDLFEEIPYRIFNKLATILFAGHLKNAVFLDIRNLNTDVSGATFTHGWGPNSNVKRISVILNIKALKYSNARDVVAILIHHMIHAYFLVACGPQKEDEAAYGRLDHGLHFGKVMIAIKKLSATQGKPLTSLDFGHNSVGADSYTEDCPYPGGITFMERQKEDKKKWYCSHCHHYVEPITESAIDKWYSKACKPLFDLPSSVRKAEVTFYNDRRHELETKPRGRLLPSDKSLEFLFKKKPILIDSKKVNALLSARRAFEKAGIRFLEVHKTVSEKTFLLFLDFLHTGSYQPDLASHTAMISGLGMARNGPPIIRPPGSSREAPLLADVQFAKLGNAMGFDECKAYALDRMNAYGVLCEDPIAILMEIYDGDREPDLELKSWARKFLVQAPSNASVPFFSEPGSPSNMLNNASEPPNLIKLESEQGSHRARFIDAIEASGALENDVNKARVELKAKGWYPWSHTAASMNLFPPAGRYSHHPSGLFGTMHPSGLLLGDAVTSSLSPSAWMHPTSTLHNYPGSLVPPSLPSLSPTSPSVYTALDRHRQRERERDREIETAKQLVEIDREMRRDAERLKLLALEKEKQKEEERERERFLDAEYEREHLKKLERERIRREAAKIEWERERERERLRALDDEGERERLRKIERERVRREAARIEWERAKEVERELERERMKEVEKARIREVEKELERERKIMERIRADEALERFYRRGGKGFVREEEEE